MLVEISNGELLDKISILIIKKKNIIDSEKLANVNTELTHLLEKANSIKPLFSKAESMTDYLNKLTAVNQKLWNIEDRIRKKEAAHDFDDDFIELARSVYFTNDVRSTLKREINMITGSSIVEEKQYEKY